MSGIFGGNQGKNNMSNMNDFLNQSSPPPPPPQNQMRHEMGGPVGLDNILNQINPASSITKEAVRDADRFENFSTASEKDIMNTDNVNIKSININKKKKKKSNRSSDDGGLTLNL